MKEQNVVSKWYVGLMVLLVISGIIMLVWPNLTMDLLGIMIGICMLVVGLVHVIIYFTRENKGSVMQMDLTVGVVLAAFGAFMLMHKDFVALLLPFAASVILLVGGLSLLQNALDMKRMAFLRWQIMLGFAVAMLAVGVVLLYNPFTERVLIYVIGICMIIDGLASITAILMISHRFKKIARGAMYTGRDNLIVDQEAQGGTFGKKDKHNTGMNASGPVETVDDPVMAAPETEKKKKKSGLFGLFGKKKKDDSQQEGSAQTDVSGQDVWNSAGAGDSFGSDMQDSHHDGASDFTGADAAGNADAFIVPDEPAVNDAAVPDEPAAANDFSAVADPFTVDDAAGGGTEESEPGAGSGSGEGAAGDGEIKDPFDLG